MKTAVINIKTEPQVKAYAQNIAEMLGLSLSDIINGYLHQFIRTRSVHFELGDEIPSKYLQKVLKESEEERKKGEVYKFDKPKKALNFIDKLIKKHS